MVLVRETHGFSECRTFGAFASKTTDLETLNTKPQLSFEGDFGDVGSLEVSGSKV